MEEKAMRVGSAIVAVIMAVIVGGFLMMAVLLIMCCHDVVREGSLMDKYETLDRESYKYDADDAFLFIDTSEGVGAVYIGTVPVGHFKVENSSILRNKERTFDTPTLVEWKED